MFVARLMLFADCKLYDQPPRPLSGLSLARPLFGVA